MNKNLVDNCLRAIEKSKRLKPLNMFITETYDLALKQAENKHQTSSTQSKYFQAIGCPENLNQYYF